MAGFEEAGLTDVRQGVIPDCGHFSPEEQPEKLWDRVAEFLGIKGD